MRSDSIFAFMIISLFILFSCSNQTIANGNSGFPLGFYDVSPSDENFSRIKGLGFNYVHRYWQGNSLDEKSLKRDVDFLNLAQKHKLKVMFNLYGRKWVEGSNGLEGMGKLVDKIKNHPALGLWLVYDEPDLGGHQATPEQLKPFYDMLKSKTPNVPVVIVFGWSERWNKYNNVLDILQYDVYPVYGNTTQRSSLQHVTNWTEDVIANGVAAMPVIQAFNYKSLAKGDNISGWQVDQLRYPNIDELRYMTYGCLAQGVEGLFYWSYSRSIKLGTDWIDTEFKEFADELTGFVKKVKFPDKPSFVFDRAKDDNVYMAMWENSGESYLVMVNAWPLERKISRWTQGKIKEAQLRPWGLTSDKNAYIENGKINVHAKPWEVFIWKVKTDKKQQNSSKQLINEFPIGFLDVYPNQNTFKYLRSIGFNYVHRYWQGNSLDKESVQRDLNFLDLAYETDLKVMFHLYGQNWVNDPNGLKNMRTLVDTFKNHPALGMWQIYDEPDTGGHQNSSDEIEPFSRMLKHNAPNIPISIIFAWSDSWYKYKDLLDICMLDYYTVMDEEPNQASLKYTPRFTGKMKGLGKESIPILQAFNYACFYQDKEEVKLKRKMRKVADLRYPTSKEMRYLCFSSIAQGADGLFFYSHRRSTQLGEEWLKTKLAPIIKEVSIFADEVILKGKSLIFHNQDDNKTVWFSKTKLDEICLTGWMTSKEDYLILTNNSSKVADIQRKIDKLSDKTFKLIPWGKTRKTDAKLINGELECKANPWEVFIWELK